MQLNVFKTILLTMLFTWSLSWMRAETAIAAKSTHVARFELYSHGMTVGHGRIIRKSIMRDKTPCTEVRLVLETRVNLLVFKLDMRMDESWISDADGLVAYSWKSTENGHDKQISGELRDGVFEFKITEQGSERSVSIPCADFDVAAIECRIQPGRTLAEGESREVRVLDPSRGTVVKRVYHGTGRKTLTIDKKEITCETVLIKEEKTHIQRWFIEDALGPLILREESDKKRGSYSRRVIHTDVVRDAEDGVRDAKGGG